MMETWGRKCTSRQAGNLKIYKELPSGLMDKENEEEEKQECPLNLYNFIQTIMQQGSRVKSQHPLLEPRDHEQRDSGQRFHKYHETQNIWQSLINDSDKKET